MLKQITAPHSFEAFNSDINIDLLIHQKCNGSFLASPSATFAYINLINSSNLDEESKQYLR